MVSHGTHVLQKLSSSSRVSWSNMFVSFDKIFMFCFSLLSDNKLYRLPFDYP